MSYLLKKVTFVALLLFSILAYSQDETKSNPVVSVDPEWQATIINAKKTLPYFRSMLVDKNMNGAFGMIKAYFPSQRTYLWFMVTETKSDAFIVTAFETFPELPQIKVGEYYSVKGDEVVDWSLNQDGNMYGGYSMRYHRNKKSNEEKKKYDSYVGVNKWMPLH